MSTVFHNPDNLTPEQYRSDRGWRLCTVQEVKTKLPMDSQFWWLDALWSQTNKRRGFSGFENVTYRTKKKLTK